MLTVGTPSVGFISGESTDERPDLSAAARAYGSIIDLYPSRADMRRMAGERLERLKETAAELTVDTYRQAVEQRPDHPSSRRLYAWALFRDGKYQEAFDAACRRAPADHWCWDGVHPHYAGHGIMAREWMKTVSEMR